MGPSDSLQKLHERLRQAHGDGTINHIGNTIGGRVKANIDGGLLNRASSAGAAMKAAISRTALAAAAALLSPQAAADASLIRAYDNAELFKNYAFAQCIASAYRSDEVRADALSVANAYVQFGETSNVDAYGKAAELAGQWLHKNYRSKSGSSLLLMKCIDFQHSAELEALTRKYVP